MNNILRLFVMLVCITSTSINATVIARDLSHAPTFGLLDYSNNYRDAFSSSSDSAQIYQKGIDAIPAALIDDTLSNPLDDLGIITSSNTVPFFGIVDTTNPNNPSGDIEASWLFNIDGFKQLLFSIDIAAMGDFESSDFFSWHYQIDNLGWQSLMTSSTDEQSSNSYQLESNKVINLNDPLSTNGRLLSNNFSAFTKSISGTGSILALKLNAVTNGGSEAIAFQQLLISGESITDISEPNQWPIIMLALGLLAYRQKLR